MPLLDLKPEPDLDAVWARNDDEPGAPDEDYWRSLMAEVERDERPQPDRGVARDGATFILDQTTVDEARWGRGSEVLWARGESMMLVGPPGAGKTTVAIQLVAALVGIVPDVLGYPVQQARRVLYLALDRPKQIRRAMGRLFNETHRDVLSERLTVYPVPLPALLDKAPEQLKNLAEMFDADVLVVDSLKDTAAGLVDDDVAALVNRAIQMCNAADVDVCVLHHQRKGQNGTKPTTLEAVYGNTWLTAGTGSVVLLWGEAGSELVELIHLKPPADPVGPLKIEHDHHAGTSRVQYGFDALAYVRSRPNGVTVADLAHAMTGTPQASGSADYSKARRRLGGLKRDGLVHHQPGALVGAEGRYFAIDTSIDTRSER